MRTYSLFILLFCLCWTTLKAEIVFDAADVSHPFMGFGAQIWPGDSRIEALSQSLNLKYYRIAPGGCTNPPTDATVVQMDAYVNLQYNNTSRGNSVIASLQMAQNLGVKVIFIKFGGCPDSWLILPGDQNQLKSENFDDFARVWASEVLFFKSRGLPVDYIELLNEPEGTWNIKVPPADYNILVKLVRAELDSRGLTDVGIAGPGLAYLYYGTSWIGSLDTDGKNALAAWSTHAWDEGWGHTDALPSYLDQRWQDYFGAAVNLADPSHLKPVIVTEYASGVRTFNGVTYSTDEYGDTSQFAERCYENSLTLANNGANVLCFWEAANQSWQSQPMYAFLRINSTLRPTYYVMSTLMPYVPDNAMVLTKAWNDPVISAAGFVGSGKLVLAFANSSASTVNRTISVQSVTSLSITSILAFQSGAVINKTSDFSYDFEAGNMAISLPPESTLTVIADINQCGGTAAGDLDSDCKVTFTDFTKVTADWLKDNRAESEGNVVEDFESYSDTAAMLAKWVPTANVVLTLDTSVVHSGSKAMKYSYNNGASPWFSKAMCYAAPSGSGVNWTGFDTLTLWFKCTVSKEPMQVNVVNKNGINILTAPYGTPQVGNWTKWDIDLTSISPSELAQVGRVDIFFLGSINGAGTTYFDDISVRNSGSLQCSNTPAGDVNGDCVVNFEDIKVLSENWLQCFLVEQSECW
ncbi:MAG: hypothetical protein WC496_03960 [Phycisphaerae bacterium]|jgi:hypothetical protein